MLNKIKASAFFALVILSGAAMAGPELPNGGGGTFTALRTWLQSFVDFMAGPFGTAAIIVSIIIGFLTWAYAPKEGIVGTVLRVVVSGIVILNASTWVMSFQA